jgi:hypothetical protein
MILKSPAVEISRERTTVTGFGLLVIAPALCIVLVALCFLLPKAGVQTGALVGGAWLLKKLKSSTGWFGKRQ